MPPRPFPWPLSVGTDICAISRIREVLTNTGWRSRAQGLRQHSHGCPAQRAKLRHFLHTLMTYDEILHFLQRFPFVLAVDNRSPTYDVDNKVRSSDWHPTNAHLAGRFAAKEAISKAFGGNVSRHQITILRSILDSHQQPQAVVHAEPRVMSPQQKLHLHKMFGFHFDDLDTQVSLENFNPVPARAEDLEGQFVKLSISHDGNYATAVCIAPTAVCMAPTAAAASQVDAPFPLGDAIGDAMGSVSRNDDVVAESQSEPIAQDRAVSLAVSLNETSETNQTNDVTGTQENWKPLSLPPVEPETDEATAAQDAKPKIIWHSKNVRKKIKEGKRGRGVVQK